MPINFPNSPSPNQQYTYDNKTWEWNGTYWEVYSALTSYITSAYTVGNGYSDISGVTGGNIVLKSFSGVNINIIDGGDKLTFSGDNTDTYVTGFTYSNNTFTIKQNNSQPDLTQTINSVTGWTVNGNLSVTSTTSSGTISATTYQNLPVSAVTSGTGISASTSNGVVTITNTSPNQIVTISGGTGITTGGTYPNFTITNSAPDQTVTISGGTGITTGGTYPNFILVNSAPDQTVTISGGTGITTGGTYPNFTIVNSAPDQTVTITGGTNIQINGTYPNFGIDFTGTTGGGPTLVASNTCLIPADGSPYIGSSSVGWGYFQWDTRYEDPIRPRNVTNGIPLPKDVNQNDIIRVCGIAYCDASVPQNDTLGVILSYFICGDLKVNLISQSGYTYERNGTVCFNLEATYIGKDTLISCETFLILGFSSSLSDASQIKISYTIKIE